MRYTAGVLPIRETIKNCPNAVHIKDDIVVHGTRDNHDGYLRQTLATLQKKGITLRPDKCNLRKEEVKWFGYIFSKAGMSSDPDKCNIIKEWPSPKSGKEVKCFLQTVQFNAKFLGGSFGDDSYPVLTEPLRNLTKKNATFVWGSREQASFDEIRKRLCSERVMSPYDTKLKTRLYVDSSPTGTQATLAQLHRHKGADAWKPVNHTSRAWTKAEAGYGQIERESNGILSGMTMNKMYTLGTQVEVVTDHKPLIPLYNTASRPKNLRVDRHRTKLLPYSYTVIHESGESSPCDYGSRHPPDHRPTKQEETDWCIEDDTDIFVNRIITDNLPHAITREELKAETRNDQSICELIASIGSNRCPDSAGLAAYRQVFTELWTIDGILMRNNQIVIPRSLRARAVETAHQGHQHTDKTLKLLRQTCWFPQMHKAVSEFVQSCIGCNAASAHNPPVPLEPNFLPDGPWQKLHGDFKGPIAGSYYLHIMIDQYSKYPEVDVLTSTSFQKLKPVLDRIFSTHGIPETLTTDNGPPYSGNEMSDYSKHMGFKLTPVTPDDPQSNGFAENFIKQMCKLVHTAVAEKKNPKEEVHNYLLQYRATPHSTTEYSPAELLFGRRIKTKLPQIAKRQETDKLKRMRQQHDRKKQAQKQYFDKRYRANEKPLMPGDNVLLKQKKSSTNPPYNPKPYKVIKVDGNRATINDGERERVRDKNKLKFVPERPAYLQIKQSASARQIPRREADIHINISNQDARQRSDTAANQESHQNESLSSLQAADEAGHEGNSQAARGVPADNQVETADTSAETLSMEEHLQRLLAAADARTIVSNEGSVSELEANQEIRDVELDQAGDVSEPDANQEMRDIEPEQAGGVPARSGPVTRRQAALHPGIARVVPHEGASTQMFTGAWSPESLTNTSEAKESQRVRRGRAERAGGVSVRRGSAMHRQARLLNLGRFAPGVRSHSTPPNIRDSLLEDMTE